MTSQRSTHVGVSRGFSLLEILIAISVLAILALLLSSTFERARSNSENTKCQYHLRQLGIALFAYAADNQGMILPRNLGLYREEGVAKPPVMERPWPNRLLLFNYISDPNILYCPSFTPYSNAQAASPLPSNGKMQTYGLRTWVTPGNLNWTSNRTREEHKPLSAIDNPADFFLVTDTYWSHPAYASQGYGIAPGMHLEQHVHLRHRQQANALFADGHVAAKSRQYFEELHLTQSAFSGNQPLRFGVIDENEF